MITELLLSCVLLSLLLLAWVYVRRLRTQLFLPMQYALERELVMPDGGVIELRRIRAGEHTDETPVLMIHGLAMNHRNNDHAEDASLARYLSAQGRDVWLLTLRSGRLRPAFRAPHSAFEAMALHDVPRAVESVLSATGQAQLDVVGFSMGGMLLYAGLGRALDPARVRRALLIGAPARVRPLRLLSFASRLPPGLTPSVPMRLWMRGIAGAPSLLSPILCKRLYNPRNMTLEVERSTLWNAWEDIPGRLGADFVRWAAQGGELTVRGERVLDGLKQVGVPVCFFAGTQDWLAPVETVRAGYDAWGCDVDCSKHFVVLGRETGAHEDYGHCDLAFGRYAREELFEPAAHFLATGELALPKPVVEVAEESAGFSGGGTTVPA